MLFLKAKVIQIELFKQSNQRWSFTPIGGSKHGLVCPDTLPVMWENTVGGESLELMESVPQGEMVCELLWN